MNLDIPSIVETQLTGRLGQANRKVRGVDYAVVFILQAGEIAAAPFRNGMAVDWSPLTRKMAAQGIKFFSSTNIRPMKG